MKKSSKKPTHERMLANALLMGTLYAYVDEEAAKDWLSHAFELHSIRSVYLS